MKRTTTAILMLLIFAASVFSQNTDASAKVKIAVYVTGSAGENEKKALGTKILIELVNSGRYRAVERSDDFVKELNREQSKQMSGAVDNSQITKIGKQFGVAVICVADVAKAFGSNQISVRLIDVESAEIMAISDASSPLMSMDDLATAAKKVVRGILNAGKSKKSRFGKVEPAKPAKPAELTKSPERDVVLKPVDTVNTKIAKLDESTESSEPVKPAENVESATVSEASEEIQPVEPIDSAEIAVVSAVEIAKSSEISVTASKRGSDLRPAKPPKPIKPPKPAKPLKPPKPPKPVPPDGYVDFTDKERLKTYALNWVPGLGSFLVMKDNVGGGILAGTAIAGAALLYSGIKVDKIEHERVYPYSGVYYTDEYSLNSVFWVGCGILAGSGVFNIVRSVTYHKPFTGTVADNADGFYFAVLPDRRDGFSAVALYSRSF